MGSDCWVWEQTTLIRELIQGMEMTKQLKEELTATSPNEISRELLVQGILSSYEKALLILQWSGPTAQPKSQNLINGSPQAEELGRGVEDDYQETKEGSKKRKTTPKWTEQVRINTENGLEGQHEDSYSWRKYGQKDILGAKFPRSYYRCSYRNTQNCWATKQVQRSDENTAVFEITYRGKHSCSNGGQQSPPSSSQEKQEQKLNNDEIPHRQQNYNESGASFRFPSSSFGHGFQVDDDSPLFKTFSQPFVFPSTLESSSGFSSCDKFINSGTQKVQRSESDLTDIFSATTSSTNSPILDLDFALDSAQIESNFPFGSIHGFFP